jgi:hypothetical protein
MDNHCSVRLRKLVLISACVSSLIGLVSSAQAAPETSSRSLNPCPKIYYEEPWNSTRIVPQGCPPNALTRQNQAEPNQSQLNPNPGILNEPPYRGRVDSGSSMPNQASPTPSQSSVIQPPLPEEQYKAIAVIQPVAGRVTVTLRNNTNTAVSYQVIEHTEVRALAGRSETRLQNLPTPVTITLNRGDGGFLQVIPQVNSQSGALDVLLDEASTVNEEQNALRIRSDGQVFLN